MSRVCLVVLEKYSRYYVCQGSSKEGVVLMGVVCVVELRLSICVLYFVDLRYG